MTLIEISLYTVLLSFLLTGMLQFLFSIHIQNYKLSDEVLYELSK